MVSINHSGSEVSAMQTPDEEQPTNFTQTTSFHDQDFWEYQAGKFIFTYPMGVIIIFGLVGNALAFLVFNRSSMRQTTTSVYFRMLSVTESTVLISCGLYSFLQGAFDYNLGAHSLVICKLMCTINPFSCYCSCWVLVVMSGDRFIGVYFPCHYKQLCSKSRAKTVMLVVILVITFTVGTFNAMALTNDPEQMTCTISIKHRWFFENVYQYFDLTLLNLIPTVILFIINIAIIIRISQADTSRQNTTSCTQNKNHFKVSSATMILMSASIVYFLCTGPTSTKFLAKRAFMKSNSLHAKAQYYLYHAMCITLYNFSHGVNFVLYCIHGVHFRREFKALLDVKATSKYSSASRGRSRISALKMNTK